MALERDPSDGQVTFIEASLTNFQIDSLENAYLALEGLYKTAKMFKESHGYVAYPILVVEDVGAN